MLNAKVTNTDISFETSQGVALHASLLRCGRYNLAFEVYQPVAVLRVSEVLSKFRLTVQDVEYYHGRAVIVALMDTGSAWTCEVTLEEEGWKVLQQGGEGDLKDKLLDALHEAERDYVLEPEYKLVVTDMHSLLSRLKLWSDQVELAWSGLSQEVRQRKHQEFSAAIGSAVIPRVDAYFERFETVAKSLPMERVPAHRDFMRRLLHPLVLCAPFPHRAYYKPLGYAGDYEMVGMMARNQPGGTSIYARAVDAWFLKQPPAEAHRNRIQVLVQHLRNEATRLASRGRKLRVFDVACGPAAELRQFLAEHPISVNSEITLLDFNAETLSHTSTALDGIARDRQRNAKVEVLKKSVHHLIKESVRGGHTSFSGQYDFVYCAGLFDYLTDEVSRRLMNLMYNWLAPGGLLISTNVEPSNPLRQGMEHLLDWHLVYRNGGEMLNLRPTAPEAEYASRIERTGFNVFLEVRKPE